MQPYSAYLDSGFEWLGEVPEHWSLVELGRNGTFSKGGGGTKEDEVDEGLPCVRYGDLYTKHQFLIRDTRARISEESAVRYVPIHYGDLLFAGSGETIEEIGKSAVNLITEPAFCGGDVILFRPSIEIDAAFLGYAADCTQAVCQKACMGRGVTVMHIYASELKHLRLPLPPLDEQRDIADFLDRETERIDSLIAKKRLLIERLQEYRTALITRTVTRGLPAEAARAAGLDPSPRLKPSGVEWLGDVPEHWDVRPLRRLLSEPLKYGANEAAERDDPDDPRYVRITDIDDSDSLRDESFRSLLPEVAAPYLLREGDLLFARSGATVGKSFLYRQSWGQCAYAGYLIRARLQRHEADPRFVRYFTASHAYWQWINSAFIQATIQNVSAERYGNLSLPIAPTEEQSAIVSFLDSETQRIDVLTARINAAIERLQEYRSALITAAVTGRIDVRDPASSGRDSAELPA